MEKITAFFLSVLMFFGVFGGVIEVKNQVEIGILSFSDADISDGYAVDVPFSDGAVMFNRISFDYEATAAVRAVFEYKQDLRTFTEELLLSSKENSASMLLDGYLKRKTASRLVSVRFEPVVKGQSCTLSVSGFRCEIQTVPAGDTVFIENGRFKAGVSLRWGGGLSYFEDKNDTKYGNLLNNHDTGRLVQQSYYGPTEIKGYENGVYMNNVWPYNPVQGGDQFFNTSKLVAIEKTDDEIRVVCRPLDWALNNKPTQAYYKNIYKLTEKGLAVENTVVDFLQTQWAPREQELPAFYTISALGTFSFYDGDRPWTDDTLRKEENLGFWSGKGAFGFKEGNTEKWCAWTDESGYGAGIFSPSAQSLLAGRFEYDGSADPGANSTNYVAPVGVLKLDFDKPFTYYYYITAGKISEIRSTFRNYAGVAGGAKE